MSHVLKNQSKEAALITDLQKTDTLNPFSEESKKIIHNLGNVELFELYEGSTKTPCPSCAKYWSGGVLYCKCGQCQLPSEKQGMMTKEKFDWLSVPYFLIKEGASRGARHGKSEEQYDHHHQAVQCLRKVKKNQFGSIHERHPKQDSYRESHMVIGDEKSADTWINSHWKTGSTRLPEESAKDTRTTGS